MNISTIRNIALAFAVTATTAFANDHLVQIRDHARDLEKEFRGIQQGMKNKNFSTADLQQRVDWTAERVNKLKSLSAEFESAYPNLAAGADWKRTKELVDLIGIVHGWKSEAVANGAKNRNLLKSHAEGLAQRAAWLQAAASKLLVAAGS